jgi:hypothetical protein
MTTPAFNAYEDDRIVDRLADGHHRLGRKVLASPAPRRLLRRP